jgi:hypothetical protein
MTAATDALREALEALDIDAVESEVDELRNALDTARDQMREAITAIREAAAKVQAVAANVRQLCEPDEAGVIHEEQIVAAVDSLGGPDSSDYGVLDDLDSAADSLDSAAGDITSALGDEQQQDEQAAAGDGQAVAP